MKVGIIGCGRIAFEAHIPAYKKYNVEVVGVCDLIEDRAKKAAEELGISFYCMDARELAEYSEVELIDIATPPYGRRDLLKTLYKSNKPMLIQKPLSYDLDEAKEICKEIKNNKIIAAVNHNARWAPVSVKIKELLQEKELGEIYQIHHINRFNENLKSWYTDVNNYIFLDHGLHYFDLIRLFSDKTPIQVSAISRNVPGQLAKCELLYTVNFKFDNLLVVSLYFNNLVPAPYAFDCQWFIDGTKASIKATLDSISIQRFSGEDVPMTKVEGDWVPEGFLGAYEALVHAIKTKKIPPHSPEDHLETLKMAIAAAKSASSGGKWVDIN